MAKDRKSAAAEGSVLRDAKEITAVEQYWHTAEKPKSHKPPKNYAYVDELAHLQFELIKLQESVRLQGLKVAVIFEGRIVYETPRDTADLQTIGRAMAGHT